MLGAHRERSLSGVQLRFMREIISSETPRSDRRGARRTDIALCTLESTRAAGGNYALPSSLLLILDATYSLQQVLMGFFSFLDIFLKFCLNVDVGENSVLRKPRHCAHQEEQQCHQPRY